MTQLITKEIFRLICKRTPAARIESIVNALNKVCPIYGINTADIFHEFFANLCEESAEFTRYEENLYYSTPERIKAVWPARFPTVDSAKQFARDPSALAMKVYGNRHDLGNVSAEDGWIFRGGGLMQLTGRSNYTGFGDWMAKKFGIIKTPEVWAELLRTDDEFAVHSACWIFAIAKKLIDEAERDDIKTIVLRINGGLTNYASRLKYYELAKRYIV